MTELASLPNDLRAYQSRTPADALSSALAAVRAYCHWHIAPARTETLTLYSADRSTLFVPTLALTAITSLTQDGTLLGSTSYEFEPYGAIRRTAGYRYTSTAVTAVVTHGYDDLPADVKELVLSLAQRSISDNRGRVVTTPTGQATTANVVENYGPRLTDADKERLAPYVIIDGFA